MRFYQHLRGRGYKQAKNTLVQVFQTNILIPLVANQSTYTLEEKSSVERNFAVGIWVIPPLSAAIKPSQNLTIAAEAVWNSGVLILRQDDKEIYRKLYLWQILKANENGFPYYLEIFERINLSESQLIINNPTAIAANTAIDINIDYVKRPGL